MAPDGAEELVRGTGGADPAGGQGLPRGFVPPEGLSRVGMAPAATGAGTPRTGEAPDAGPAEAALLDEVLQTMEGE